MATKIGFKRCCLFILWAAGAFSGLHAAGDDWLRLVSEGGTTEWAVRDLRKITFTFDGMMLVKSKDGVQSFTCKSLDKLYFWAQSTGVTTASGADGSMAMHGPSTVSFPQTPAGGRAFLYRPDGTLVRVLDVAAAGGPYRIDGLSRGIYMIHFSGQTLKFVQP